VNAPGNWAGIGGGIHINLDYFLHIAMPVIPKPVIPKPTSQNRGNSQFTTYPGDSYTQVGMPGYGGDISSSWPNASPDVCMGSCHGISIIPRVPLTLEQNKLLAQTGLLIVVAVATRGGSTVLEAPEAISLGVRWKLLADSMKAASLVRAAQVASYGAARYEAAVVLSAPVLYNPNMPQYFVDFLEGLMPGPPPMSRVGVFASFVNSKINDK